LEVQPAVYTKEQDKKIPNGRFVTMTGSRPELNKQANVNINENKEMNSYVAQQMVGFQHLSDQRFLFCIFR
jgi:hypothetical protein